LKRYPRTWTTKRDPQMLRILLSSSWFRSRYDPIKHTRVDAAAATAITGTHQTGQLRFNGRKHELPAIDALESHVIDPSQEQSTTTVLDKISGAVLIGGRQRQARLQLVTAIAEQLLVENKRSRDTETAAMNMLVGRLRDSRTVTSSLMAGAGADLRGWRQP
jgi:hypothetical protein